MPDTPAHSMPPPLHELLLRVQKPARYVGNEKNMVRKERAVDLRMVISYPDIYEIGMSNLGIRILYEAVNAVPNLSCERVFAPWLDFEDILRKHRIPLFSLESFTPLNRFDVLGFSLGYELLYTNLLAVIELGGIPLRSADREEGCPIVIAGGPAVLNPEPVADFIDVFLVGDGESSIVEFLLAVVSLRGKKRKDMLRELDRFSFAYIPSLYRTKSVRGYLFTDVDKIVRRRIEPDLDALPYPRMPLVPVTRIVQERVNVEVSRGCATGCRFCQAGFIYRPVRERSVQAVADIVDSCLRHSGYEEVSLLSLNVGEFSALEDLVRAITERYSADGVSVSLPSLKVNSVNLRVLEMIRRVRKSGLTFAVESPDEFVRSALNKPVGGEQLEEIIGKVTELGWKLIKLYFMIGLPTAEREGEAIERFLLDVSGMSPGLSVNASVSVFVPKPHTPFERETQMGVEDAERIIHSLRRRFGRSKIRIKFQNPRMSLVEGLLSRGDRSLGRVIEGAFRRGERFSSWDDEFDYAKWQEALREADVDPARYLVFDGVPEPLPWDFIDTGLKKEFFSRERAKSRTGELTGSCLEDGCPGCGVCGGDIRNRTSRVRSEKGSADAEYAVNLVEQKGEHGVSGFSRPERVFKVVFRFVKLGLFRYISHLDLLSLFARTLRMTGLPVAVTSGFNPKPRLSLPFALILGAESRCEIGEVHFSTPVPPEAFVERMNEVLDPDVKIEDAKPSFEGKSIASKPFIHEYVVTLLGEKYRDPSTIMNINNDFSDKHYGFQRSGKGEFSVRLKGTTSVKDFLEKLGLSPYECSILRTGLGEDRNGTLVDFLQ